MDLELERAIKDRICGLPVISRWPQIANYVRRQDFSRTGSLPSYPLISCQATGGPISDALTASAAVLCAIAAIHLVDDVLDEDEEGLYRKLGAGQVANLALTFQAASHQLLTNLPINIEQHIPVQTRFAEMLMETAYGQYLDLQSACSEADYWRMAESKTCPLFGFALYLGAVVGGASEQVSEQLRKLGRVLGSLIQIGDDLGDALQTPAQPDWRRPYCNLPILYASIAKHRQQERFQRLVRKIDDHDCLAEAQKILFDCGAVAYCVFKILERLREARQLIASILFVDPRPIMVLVDDIVRPVLLAFHKAGVEFPERLVENYSIQES